MRRLRYKDVQAMHETRMWFKDVVIPIGGLMILLYKSNPGVVTDSKDKLTKKVKKLLKKEL